MRTWFAPSRGGYSGSKSGDLPKALPPPPKYPASVTPQRPARPREA